MSALDDIMNQLPINQLASELGQDPAAIQAAAGPAITSLLGGLTQNAQNPQGEAALAQALVQHGERNTPEQFTMQDLNPAEGEQILGHVFGNQTDGVAQALSGQAGVSGDLVRRLLPLLAPVVMAYLAKNLLNGQNGNILGSVLGGQQGQVQNQGMLGGVLSQVLGHVMGGNSAPAGNPFDPTNAQATAQQAQAQNGDIVSQILGGLLGRR